MYEEFLHGHTRAAQGKTLNSATSFRSPVSTAARALCGGECCRIYKFHVLIYPASHARAFAPRGCQRCCWFSCCASRVGGTPDPAFTNSFLVRAHDALNRDLLRSWRAPPRTPRRAPPGPRARNTTKSLSVQLRTLGKLTHLLFPFPGLRTRYPRPERADIQTHDLSLCVAREKGTTHAKARRSSDASAKDLKNAESGLAGPCLRTTQCGESTAHALQRVSCIKVPDMDKVLHGFVGMYRSISEVCACASAMHLNRFLVAAFVLGGAHWGSDIHSAGWNAFCVPCHLATWTQLSRWMAMTPS